EGVMSRSAFHQAFPPGRVSGIDSVENKGNSFLQFWKLGYAKRNPRVTNFIFRANEALAHGGRRSEKRRRNSRGVDAKDSLQHQRRARGRINGRMRTNEKKFQSFVGKVFLRLRDDLRFLGD